MNRSCDEWQNAFWEAIDGELAPEPSAALAEHLRTCPECRAGVRAAASAHRQLLEAAVQGDIVASEPVPAFAPADLPEPLPTDELSTWRQVRPRSRRRRLSSATRRRRGPVTSPLAVAIMMLLGLGILLLLQSGSGRRHPVISRPNATQAVPPAWGQPGPRPVSEPSVPRLATHTAVPVGTAPGTLSPSASVASARRGPRTQAISPSTVPPAIPGSLAQVGGDHPPASGLAGPNESPPAPGPEAGGTPAPLEDGEPNRAITTSRPIARLGRVAGLVMFHRGNQGRWVKAVEGIPFLAGDRLDTRTGLARLDLEGTSIYANHRTVFRVLREEGLFGVETRIDLAQGEVYVEEDLRQAKVAAPLHVQTPDGRVSPVGTRFSVKHLPSETVVVVQEGAVRIAPHQTGLTVAVQAGHRTRFRRGERPAPPVQTHAERHVRWSERLGARGGRRVTADLQALYLFHEEKGFVVKDTSRVGKPLDLQIRNPGATRWLRGGGLWVRTPTIIASAEPATKIIDACGASNALTVEAWIRPATLTPKSFPPARIITLSGGIVGRNFTLGQDFLRNVGGYYSIRYRTTETSKNGFPYPTSGFGVVRTAISHVVCTREADGTHKIYINGVESPGLLEVGVHEHIPRRDRIAGEFTNWDAGYPLVLANELSQDRPWRGRFYLVAIYSRALHPAEVRHNFAAGAGRYHR